MPNEANIIKLMELIKALPEGTPVQFDYDHMTDDCDWTLEPITSSCDYESVVIGYIVTNKGTVN